MSSSAIIIAAYGPCGSVMEMTTVWMEVMRRATAAVRILKSAAGQRTACKHINTLYVQILYMSIHLHAQPCSKQEKHKLLKADCLMLSTSMLLNATEVGLKSVPPPHCHRRFCSC